MITRRAAVVPYTTKDGSEIRELMHPAVHGNRAQSLAEAVVPAGAHTRLHRHRETEELYHVTAGEGVLTLGEERIKVSPGDTALIPPGMPHRIESFGPGPLRFLCCCSPAYRHEDTELLEGDE
ncbi:MAG: cupin domain-containing protein [Zoogloeaceae bacterium]|nr:cupin domain-containing protein [Zoogloeaceae bacterium]MCK6384286.1 cupin domain-containing protein [Rhodocyclaceae bacterium]